MPSQRPDRLSRALGVALAASTLLAGIVPGRLAAQSTATILGTKHNLAVSGPGPVRALGETRVCVFCHTPHNATPLSPLWNRQLDPQSYTVYASPTLKAGPLAQPSGPTKLCLSCHDGTIAMGAVLNPTGGITMAGGGTFPSGSLSDFGTDLSGHHPVSFPYHASLPNAELAPAPPPELAYGGTDEVHCITCHDPHDDQFGKFLLKDNRYSALCVTCHQMSGWSTSAHATSTASVVGILPRPPKTWPQYTQLAEWGCEACHTPHFAPTAEQLLNFTDAPPDPFSCTSSGCHSAQPGPPHAASTAPGAQPPRLIAAARGGADIGAQIQKFSAHHVLPGATAMRSAGGAARAGVRSVACGDCHNPHLANRRESQAPYASGMVQGVSGIDRSGIEVAAVTYEYEICFKCHGDNAPDLDYVPRVLPSTNTRLDFDTANPSYHPVVGAAGFVNVPSIPSSLEPGMTTSQIIYCTSCHADDQGGSRGPHGSSFPPILRERYETNDGTPESYENYALCYRCHERSSILADVSFRRKIVRTTPSGGGHSGHLAAGASCATCHDPHGVPAGAQSTGDHTHLINFDTRSVLPKPGNAFPIYQQTGPFSGSCTLVCHGVTHDSTSYP